MRFLFFLLVTTTAFLSAEIRFVSKMGSNTYPYTSWETSGRTIQGVMDSSSFGDTIYVGAGTYEELIIFKKGISLIGIDRDSCIINGEKYFPPLENWALITITDFCMVKGFTLINSKISENVYYGYGIITTYDNNNINIISNRFKRCSSAVLFSFSSGIINNNIFDECSTGINFTSPNTTIQLQILNNSFTECENGIILNSSGYMLVKNNIIMGSSPFDECIWSYIGKVEVYNNLLVGKGKIYTGFISSSAYYDDIFANNCIIGDFTRVVGGSPGAVKISRGFYYNNLIIGPGNAFIKWNNFPVYVNYNSLWQNSKLAINFEIDSTNITTNSMIALQRGDSLLTLEDTLNPLSYIPQLFSPLIDGGHPDILDKDGTRSDIGLFGGPYGEEVIYRDYAPSIPKNLKITKDTLGIFLSWNNSAEADLKNYLVYSDSVENFEITPFKLLTETKAYSIKVADSLTGSMFFKVVSIDSAGNKSFASEEVGIKKPVGLNEERFTVVDNNYLYQNYPNPFNPSTRISYKISKDGYLRLRVYDIKGELVEVIKEGTISKGYYEENYTPKGLASGMYILRIDLSDNNNIPVYSEQRKMLFVK